MHPRSPRFFLFSGGSSINQAYTSAGGERGETERERVRRKRTEVREAMRREIKKGEIQFQINTQHTLIPF